MSLVSVSTAITLLTALVIVVDAFTATKKRAVLHHHNGAGLNNRGMKLELFAKRRNYQWNEPFYGL